MRSIHVFGATRPLGAASLLLLALSVAGCGSSSSAAGPQTGTLAATAKGVTPPVATISAATLLDRVALVDGDLPGSLVVNVIPGGNLVKGQITLDNCGYHFTTEAHRVARRQTAVFTAKNQPVGVSNEVVVYDSATQAKKALAEFRTSVTKCTKKVFHKSPVKGIPPLRYADSTVTTASNLPVKDNAVASSLVSAKGTNQHAYEVEVFQRQGTVLTGIYVEQSRKPTAADLKVIHVFAVATGKRLAAI